MKKKEEEEGIMSDRERESIATFYDYWCYQQK
jgi:hypothetical protein